MKIISLKAENFKRIKALEINPNGAVVIQGANAQGKTSILDSIAYTLDSKAVKKPIRDGEQKSNIEIDLGDYIVKKVTTEKGAYLKVETKEGAQFKSPQKILDKIVGDISFDPLEFSRMKPQQQREALVKMIPALDFTRLDDERKINYDARTELGRDIKSTEAERNAIVVDPHLPDAPVNVSALMEKMNRLNNSINDENKRIADLDAAYENLLYERTRLDDDIRILKQNLATKLKLIQTTDNQLLEMRKDLPGDQHPERIQIKDWETQRDVCQDDVENASKINEKIAARDHWLKLNGKLKLLRVSSEEYTKAIEKIDHEKKTALEIIPMPIPGLSVTEKDVVFNGTPFMDLAESEKLKVSLSMAMAQNPELKVVFIRDGSLLDASSRAEVIQMAQEKDYQVWIEVTSDSAKSGLIIEDGEISYDKYAPSSVSSKGELSQPEKDFDELNDKTGPVYG